MDRITYINYNRYLTSNNVVLRKVIIEDITYWINPLNPNKLCITIDEAEEYNPESFIFQSI